MDHIISWNLNSASRKFAFIQLLLQKYNPIALCLQETKLQPKNNFSLKNYNVYRYDEILDGNAKGGVLIAVQKQIPADQINIHTPLQTIAV